MKTHLISKLTITPKKLLLEYLDDSEDPILKAIQVDGAREEALQSHIDAIAERVIKDAMQVYEEKKSQMTMFDEEPEEEPVSVPLHPDSDIPDFSKATRHVAALYIEQTYTGEDGEKGLADLVQDVKFNSDYEIPSYMSLEEAKEEAVSALYG